MFFVYFLNFSIRLDWDSISLLINVVFIHHVKNCIQIDIFLKHLKTAFTFYQIKKKDMRNSHYLIVFPTQNDLLQH